MSIKLPAEKKTEDPAPDAPASDASAPQSIPITSFFGGGNKSEEKAKSSGESGDRGRRIVMGAVFYLALFISVVGVISFCVKHFSPRSNTRTAAPQQTLFTKI